jgi:Tfp pilus assembly protein PilO
MTLRERWDRFSSRERRLIGAAGGVAVIFLVHVLVISPFLSYRQDLQDEIAAYRERIENGQAYLARTADLTRQRDQFQKAFQQVKAQLVPGDTPTLAAANLQTVLHNLAGEKGVEIQSTQVMRDDTVGDFRRIAVRITVTGDLKQLADFLIAAEHGNTRVAIPFLEISRRGAALRGKAARALSATIEVTAFLQGAGAPAGAPGVKPAADGAPGGKPAADGVPPGAPGAPAAPQASPATAPATGGGAGGGAAAPEAAPVPAPSAPAPPAAGGAV